MQRKMLVRQSCFILGAVAAFLVATVRCQQCLPGPYHHRTAREGGAGFAGICSPYKAKTCCTDETARKIEERHDKDLYAFHIDDCGAKSKACEEYQKAEACFYECDPYLHPFHIGEGYIGGVPICADFCDAWYDACKKDLLCGANFLKDYEKHPTTDESHCYGHQHRNHTCKTYAQLYGSGKNLCDRQWDTSFFYSNSSSCLTFPLPADQGKPNRNACARAPNTSTPIHAADCNIFRQSQLTASSTAPQLRASSTAPQLRASSTAPQLTARSTGRTSTANKRGNSSGGQSLSTKLVWLLSSFTLVAALLVQA